MDLYDQTRKFLARSGDREWSFTSSHILYLSAEQGRSYSRGKIGDYNLFHDETVRLISRHADAIVEKLPDNLTIVDLGPEYPDKTLPLLNARKSSGRQTDYVGVDVNAAFLDIALEAVAPYVRRASAISSLFNECAGALPGDAFPGRLAFIGLTFMNQPHWEVMPMMREIAGPHGFVGIATELVTPENPIAKILDGYRSPELEQFVFGPLKNLGVDPAHATYDVRFTKGCVDLGFVFSKSCEDLGVAAGERVMVCPSYRYSESQFAKMAKSYGPAHVWRERGGKTAFALVAPTGAPVPRP